MITPTMPTCGDCYMIVCLRDKRIIEQCGCTSARKKRIDVPCPRPPSCWGPGEVRETVVYTRLTSGISQVEGPGVPRCPSH